MYTYASAKNRYVINPLTVTYSVKEVEYETVSGNTASYFVVTRMATKNYSYLDMSERTAAKVAADKVNYYTRPYYLLQNRGTSQTYPRSVAVTTCNSDIRVVRANAVSYSVEISVKETDVRASDIRPSDPATLFDVENSRGYDDGNTALAITAVEYNSSTRKTTISFTKSSDLPTDSIIAQVLTESWENVAIESKSSTSIVTAASAVSPGDTVRIVCGPVASEPFTSPLPDHTVTFTCPYGSPSSYPSQTVADGQCYTNPFEEGQEPARPFYYFDYWAHTDDYLTFDRWDPTRPVTKDLNLVVIWRAA